MTFPVAELFALSKRGPAARGLVCDEHGVALGPCMLVERAGDATGGHSYRIRSARDVVALFAAAYGVGVPLRVDWLMGRLGSIADALARGDHPFAAIAAVHLEVPDFPDDYAHIRLAQTDRVLKANPDWPDEPRDARGRWTTGGGGNAAPRPQILSEGGLRAPTQVPIVPAPQPLVLATDKVDWNFIGGFEKQGATIGYVPRENEKDPDNKDVIDPETGKKKTIVSPGSGVTIAPGVDLGQKGQQDLNALDIPQSLKDKLSPYLGLKG